MKTLLAALFLVPALALGQLAGSRPNIILVITDDQGYGDLSCHGNPLLRTPHLDRLHDEAVRFTNFHVSPTCAPTRAALLTGRHEFRNGVTHTINERERLRPEATTIAQVLKTAGYATGIFGKWHLGDEPDRWPSKRGFDEMYIHGAGGIGQTYPGSCGDAPNNHYQDPVILHNGAFEKPRGYCTDLFFGQAMQWIEQRKDEGPFYCHIATNTPHAPLECRAEDEARYAGRCTTNEAKFYGMIANIDDNVGRLLSKLDELNLSKKTLVIYMSDNGGTVGCERFNAGMRGQKGTPYQGAIRVPSFWRWPGKISPDEREQLTAHLDFFPTLAELAGAQISPAIKTKLEGRSLLPLLEGKTNWPNRQLVTHVGRWERGQAARAKFANCAIRDQRYKLVSAAKDGSRAWALYDLEKDPSEKTDVVSSYPSIARELEDRYNHWWDSIQPDLVNEDAAIPPMNPFKEFYWRQFPAERPSVEKDN